VPPNSLVTDVIELILKGTQETLKFANGDKLKDNKSVSFYKFLVGVSSDEVSFCVHIDVIPFEVPNVQPGDTPSADIADKFYQKVQEPSGLEVSVPRNYFELDYLFTGKNLDIIHLDLKMQDLNFLLSSNVAVSEGDIFNVQGYGQGDPKDAKGVPVPKPALYSTRQYDPIFIPDTTKEQLDNFSTYVAARSKDTNYKLKTDVQSYTRNLAAFYAQSATMVNFVIRGNPLIMEKFNINTPLAHPNSSQSYMTGPTAAPANTAIGDIAKQRIGYRTYLETFILKNPKAQLNAGKGTFSVPSTLGSDSYILSPVFFKLNVKGPNVDFISGEQRDGGSFATDILTNIYYIVFKVVNIIERGVFTQEIEGYSHNVFGSGKVVREKASPRRSV
jgi:hypothetical protein